jgi:hypothetical protein
MVIPDWLSKLFLISSSGSRKMPATTSPITMTRIRKITPAPPRTA